MKRIRFTLYSLVIGLTTLQAQVVLNSSMAPQPGSLLHFQAIDEPTAFSFDKSGQNLLWDFRGYPSHATDTVEYTDPANTPYPNAYPTANLAVTMTDGIGYIENNDAQELLLGVVGDPGNGVQPMPFYPAMPLFDFPYTYGSQMNTTSQVRVKMDGASFGMPGTDSVKYHMTLTTIREVTGWGTLVLPDATYEGALLESSKTIQVDSAWMKVVFLGWISAPGYPQTTHDSSYRWLTGEMLHPFAEVNYDENGLQDGVTFFKGLNVGAAYHEASLPDLTVFPNPATSQLTVLTPSAWQWTTVRISSMDGVSRDYHVIKETDSAVKIDIQNLPAGCYVVQLLGEGHRSGQRRLIKL